MSPPQQLQYNMPISRAKFIKLSLIFLHPLANAEFCVRRVYRATKQPTTKNWSKCGNSSTGSTLDENNFNGLNNKS